MRDVVTTIEEWVYEKIGSAGTNACAGRVWPVLAPTGAAYPFMTFDLDYAETALPVGRGAPDMYSIRLVIQGWVQGETRLPLRAEWKKVFDGLVGPDGDGIKETWESAIDASQWYFQCAYMKPQEDPSAVQESDGQWRRITHAFDLHIQELS